MLRIQLVVGLLVLISLASSQAQAERLTLNLRDVDIQTLIDLVAEETGTNFIVDPRVRGRVTVVSGRPVAREELYDLFLGILRVYGFAVIPGEAAAKVIPDAQAKQGEIPDLRTPLGARDDQIVTHVIQTEHVSAAQLVPILRPLLPQGGHLAATSENHALIISDTAANVRRLQRLVSQIDRPIETGIEVIDLQHARAAVLIETLRELEGGTAEGARSVTRILADTRGNAIILSGNAERRLALRALIARLDTPVEGGNSMVHYLRYAQAEEVVEVLRGIAEAREGDNARRTEGRSGAVRIQAHQANNAVILHGAPEAIREMLDIVERLDVRRAQVMVEAVIAELSAESARQLGVQWAAGSPDNGVGIVNFDRSGRGLLQLAVGVESFLQGSVVAPRLPDGLSLGGIGRRGDTQIGLLISALQGDAFSNILSTPSLMTMDNEEAEIVVGQNVPFVVGRSVEDSGQAFDTIRREDIGVKLRVRPRINEGNAIRLEIEQEVSQIAPRGDARDLVTNTRSLRTHVMVEDGEMLVLGGLISENRVDTRDKVPGLGDIPLLGGLFRYDSERVEKRNLMIFLYPRIVRDTASGATLTSEKYSFIRRQQMVEAGRSGHAAARAGMTLPEWEQLVYLPPPFAADSFPVRRGNQRPQP